MSDRMDALRSMVERDPSNTAARFGLALEHLKREEWSEAVEHLRTYLDQTDDEGNAYGRLGHALRQLGRHEEARAAYHRGIEAARRHGHPSMAEEFEQVLSDWA